MSTFSVSTRHILAILIGFSIPISTALTNILCPLAFIYILAEGQYKQKFTTLRNHPIALMALLIFALILGGLFYTPVSWLDAGLMLDKYREFLYIPLFILIFRDGQKLGLYAFLSAMGVTLFLSYLLAITGWDIGKGTPENPFIFKNHITQGTLIALAAYFVAVQFWQEKSWRWLRGIVILLAAYNVVFMSEGRTGYLVLFCLILLFCYQIYRFRGLLLGGIFLVMFSTLVYNYSDILRHRVSEISENMQEYQQGNTNTSIGKRIEFYQNSLRLVREEPLLGGGTGSFSYQYKWLAAQQAIDSTTNPHNEYLMIAVQWGLLGVGLFVGLLYLMWQMTNYLSTMAKGLVVTIAVGCLVNSLWLDSTEGHLFAYLIGVFYANVTFSPQFNLIKILKTNKKQIVEIVGIGVIIVYLSFLALSNQPTTIDRQLAMVLLKNVMVSSKSIGKHSVLAFDEQGKTTTVATKFNSVVKFNGHSGNNLVFSNVSNIEVFTQIKVDSRHVGKKAHIVIVASLQLPRERFTKFYQKEEVYWKNLNINQLRTVKSYASLPASFHLSIHKGSLTGVIGDIKVFVGYVIEDNDTLILSMKPIQFRLIEE